MSLNELLKNLNYRYRLNFILNWYEIHILFEKDLSHLLECCLSHSNLLIYLIICSQMIHLSCALYVISLEVL